MPTYQSLWFEAPKTLGLRTLPLPSLEPDLYLVKARLSAISAGTERLLFTGKHASEQALDTGFAAASTAAYPFPYGYQMVGQVIGQGSRLSESWYGKRVFCFAPHGELAVVKREQMIPLPVDLSDEQAVVLANMETAVSLVWDAHPHFGHEVAVFGQGLVGLMVTYLLRQCGLRKLKVYEPNHQRQVYARAFGADECLSAVEACDQVDMAIELSGNPQALAEAISLTRPGGTIVIGSWYPEKAAISLGTAFHRKRQALVSSQVSSVNVRLGAFMSKARRLELALDQLKGFAIENLARRFFPLQSAVEAYDKLLDGSEDILMFAYEET